MPLHDVTRPLKDTPQVGKGMALPCAAQGSRVGLGQRSLSFLFLGQRALLEPMQGASAGNFGNDTKLLQVSSQSGQFRPLMKACLCVVDPSTRK